MLVDRKIIKISNNSFLNVQIILIKRDINLKMNDINEVYIFLKNYFLEDNSVSRRAFNFKLDSGLDIKAFYEMTHNPMYITLNYGDKSCFPCNVLPHLLIIHILNRNLAINNLAEISCEHIDKNISDRVNLSIAYKLSKCIDNGKTVEYHNNLFKAPHDFTHLKDRSNSAMSKILKSTDKLYSNYLFKKNFDDPKMQINSIPEKINEYDINNHSINMSNEIFEDKEIQCSVKDTELINGKLRIRSVTNPCISEINKIIDKTNDIVMDSVSINTNIRNIGDNLRKNINFENGINFNMDEFNNYLSNKTDQNNEVIVDTNLCLNIGNDVINCEDINSGNLNLSETNINNVVIQKLGLSIEQANTIERNNKPCKNIKKITDKTIPKVFNEVISIKKGDKTTKSSKDYIDLDIDSDFKPNIRRSKLSVQKNKRKLNFEQACDTILNQAKFDNINGYNEKIVGNSNKSDSNELIKFSNITDTYLKIGNDINSNILTNGTSKPNKIQKFAFKMKESLPASDIIDLTGGDVILKVYTPSSKLKNTIIRKSISKKSEHKMRGLKKYSFMKKKPIKLFGTHE